MTTGDELIRLTYTDMDKRLYPDLDTAAIGLLKPGLRWSGLYATTREDGVFPEEASVALGSTVAFLGADRIEFDGIGLSRTGFEGLVSNPHLSGARELALLFLGAGSAG